MYEKLKKIFPSVAIILFILTGPLYPEPVIRPVDTKNTLFLYLPHIFLPVEGGTVIEDRENELSFTIIKSNTIFDMYHFYYNGKQGVFDLETTALISAYSRKINNLTELKTTIPFYYCSGGFMDHYIEKFHKTFPRGGLRNGGREFSADNEFRISYQKADGGPDINDSFYGFGDPSFFLKRILLSDNPGITCSIGLKPETAEKAFINSNTTDIGISLSSDYRSRKFYFYVMAGYSRFFGEGIYKEELDQVRDYMISTAAGCGFSVTERLYFSIQFYLHNSIYNTGIEKIDNITVLNSYAMRWKMNSQSIIQFCIDEDPFTYATTDVAFSIRGEYTF